MRQVGWGVLLPLFLGGALQQAQIAPSTLAIVSAASYSATVAPGSFATILGAGLSTQIAQAQVDANGNFPTELGGVTVQVNGVSAQILYVSPAQINTLIPAQVQPGSAKVVVQSSTGLALQGTANVQAVAPGIFTLDASGQGAILNAVTFTAGPFNPDTAANPGCDKRTRLAIFATGLHAASASNVSVVAHDSTGASWNLGVEYAGATQTNGLDQVNVVIPGDLNAGGTMTLAVTAGAATSNTVNFALGARDRATVSAACLINVKAGAVTLNSGAQMSGSVALSEAANGAVTVNLASSSAAVQVPTTVTIPAGQTSATFQITAGSTASAQNVRISASLNGVSQSISLVLNPPCASGVTLSTSVVAGGRGLTGTVSLSAPAPDGGLVVNLQSSNPQVQVAATVTIPAGQTSANFNLSTSAGPATVQASITASVGACVGVAATVTVNPAMCVGSVAMASSSVSGGGSVSGTVTLTSPAPSGGVVVNLASNNAQAQVAASVTVPASQTSASFNVSTSAGSSSTKATITASVGGCTGATATIQIDPPPCVASVSVSSSTVTGGNSVTGTLNLTLPAPSGGFTVNLASNNAQAQVASTVTVPAGQTSANFNIATSAGSSSTQATISGNAGGCAGAAVTIQINPPPCVSSVILSANAVTSGTTVTGTVLLNGPAPSSGLVVNLQSSNPVLVQVASSIMIPGGQNSGTFTVTTVSGAQGTGANITASTGLCAGASVTLIVTPPLCVAGVSLSANTVISGGSLMGTVTLNGQAPPGGVVVALKSNNPAVQVASAVTVAGGQTSANFAVNTSIMTMDTSATITATIGACGASVMLTVLAGY